MADPFIRSHVSNLPLFAHLPPEQLELVAQAFEAYQLQPNDIVFQQGYPAQGLYVFVSGLAHLFRTTADGSEQFVGEVRGGQYVGEAALFRPMTESTSLRVIEQAVILFLSRARFEQMLAQAPEIRANVRSKYLSAASASPGVPPGKAETFHPAFPGQRPNESILVFERRRHWWALAQQTFLPLLLVGAMIILGLLTVGSALSWAIFFLSILVAGIWIGYLYYEWSNDYLIVTDQRLIHEENTLFGFQASISEIPFSSIQEVSYSVPSADPFARLFNYGTLFIRTAGQAGNMHLPFIPNPQKMQQLIINYRQSFQNALKQQNRDTIRGEIDRFLQTKQGSVPAAAQAAPASPLTATTRTRGNTFLSTRYVNEKGELVFRKHLSVWAMQMAIPLLVLFSGVMLMILSALSITIGGLGGLQLVVGFFIVLVGSVWAYWADWDWRKDMYILGDKTVRLIHKRPLWLQDTTDQILLTQIDNVVSERSGILNTLLDRGNVRIFLVGDDKKNAKVFHLVHQPAMIQDEISNRRARVIELAKKEEIQNQHRTIAEYLDVYHERINAMNQNAAQAQPQPPPPAPTPAPAPQPPPRDGTRPPRIPRVRND